MEVVYVEAGRNKPSENWRKMQPIYRYFASEDNLDFSEKAEIASYIWETRGEGNLKMGLFSGKGNGCAVGKHWMDATVKMWREDIRLGMLTVSELYEEPELKEFHWWLDRVFKRNPT